VPVWSESQTERSVRNPSPQALDAAVALEHGSAQLSVHQDGQRPRILLAEDNPVNQKLALGILAKRGHSVRVANNGREAVDASDDRHRRR